MWFNKLKIVVNVNKNLHNFIKLAKKDNSMYQCFTDVWLHLFNLSVALGQ